MRVVSQNLTSLVSIDLFLSHKVNFINIFEIKDLGSFDI